MQNTNTYTGEDRRKTRDSLFKTIAWWGLLVWFLLIVAVVLLDLMQPGNSSPLGSMISSKLGISNESLSMWNREWLKYFFYLMFFGLGLSVIGVVISFRRRRRFGDQYRTQLLLLGSMSLTGLVYTLI
jgi:preprotein translocase subunit SecG